MAADFFFLPPFFEFRTRDVTGVTIFIVMGGLIAATCEARKRAQHRAQEQTMLLERQIGELEACKAAVSQSESRL